MSDGNDELNKDSQIEINDNENFVNQKIDQLIDGTEILHDEEIEKEEQISDKNLKKLIEFTLGIKSNKISDSDLNDIRENKELLNKLLRVSYVKAKSYNYFPKKKFGVKYKTERRKKNQRARKQRAI